MRFIDDVPRIEFLPNLVAECSVLALPLVPNTVNTADIFITNLQTVADSFGVFTVTADYSFEYVHMMIGESQVGFQIWWSSARAPEEGDFRMTLPQIEADESEGDVRFTAHLERNMNFDMYLQVRELFYWLSEALQAKPQIRS